MARYNTFFDATLNNVAPPRQMIKEYLEKGIDRYNAYEAMNNMIIVAASGGDVFVEKITHELLVCRDDDDAYEPSYQEFNSEYDDINDDVYCIVLHLENKKRKRMPSINVMCTLRTLMDKIDNEKFGPSTPIVVKYPRTRNDGGSRYKAVISGRVDCPIMKSEDGYIMAGDANSISKDTDFGKIVTVFSDDFHRFI